MADVIRESGLSAGSIYSHFDGKSDLIRYAAATMVEDRGARLWDSSGHGFAPREVARLLITEILPRELRSVLLQVWAEASSDPELAPVISEQLRRVHELLTDALTPWAAAAAPPAGQHSLARARADLVMALMQGYLVRVSLDTTVDAEEVLEHLLSALED